MFPGHPGHLANSVDLGHRAGHHDPRHPLCVQVGLHHRRHHWADNCHHHQAGRHGSCHLQHFQLSLQAAGPGEGDEQGRHYYIFPKCIPIQARAISKLNFFIHRRALEWLGLKLNLIAKPFTSEPRL